MIDTIKYSASLVSIGEDFLYHDDFVGMLHQYIAIQNGWGMSCEPVREESISKEWVWSTWNSEEIAKDV